MLQRKISLPGAPIVSYKVSEQNRAVQWRAIKRLSLNTNTTWQ